MTTPHLDRLVRRARRRMRVQRIVMATGPVAALAAGLYLAWAILSRLVLLPDADVAVAAVLAAGALAAVLAGGVVRIPDVWAAWAASTGSQPDSDVVQPHGDASSTPAGHAAQAYHDDGYPFCTASDDEGSFRRMVRAADCLGRTSRPRVRCGTGGHAATSA